MLSAVLGLALAAQTSDDKAAFIRFQTIAATWKTCTKRYVVGQPIADRDTMEGVVAEAMKECALDQDAMHRTLLNDGLSSSEADELVALQINLWKPKLFDEAMRPR